MTFQSSTWTARRTILSVAWIAAGLVESTAVHGTQCSLGLDVWPWRQLIGIPGLRQSFLRQCTWHDFDLSCFMVTLAVDFGAAGKDKKVISFQTYS